MFLNKLFFILFLTFVAFSNAKEPLVAYKIGNEWSFMADDGSIIFKRNDVIDVFGYSEGYYLTKMKHNGETLWAFLSDNGEVKFYNDSDDASLFSNGYALVGDLLNREQNTKKVGFVNKKGELVVPKIYKDALNFSEGLAYVMNDSIRGYLDTNLKFKFTLKSYLVGFEFTEGLAAVTNPDYKTGYIDTNGKIFLPFLYDEPSYCSEGTIRLNTKGKFGFMDTKGNPIVSAIYGDAGLFKFGLAFVAKHDMKFNASWSIVNKKNELLSEFIFQNKHDYSDSLACVKFAGKWGFINNKAEFAFAANFDRVEDFKKGLAWASNDNGKSGFIDKNGNYKYVMPKAEKYFELRINKNVN